MTYCSIDIETTGLNPDRCQVLQFAAVLRIADIPVMDMPSFNVYLRHTEIQGEPFALSMPTNVKILKQIALTAGPADATSVLPAIIKPHDLYWLFRDWLLRQGCKLNEKVFPVGKNFGSFDRQFLKHLDMDQFWKHRTLDVGSQYAMKDGIPSLEDIIKIHGVPNFPGEAHDALWDARVCMYFAMVKLEH